jgi:hypothetical protein
MIKPPNADDYYPINTLSEADLMDRLDYCRTNLDRINGQLERGELSGDQYYLARWDYVSWLEAQIELLQHWLITLPTVLENE